MIKVNYEWFENVKNLLGIKEDNNIVWAIKQKNTEISELKNKLKEWKKSAFEYAQKVKNLTAEKNELILKCGACGSKDIIIKCSKCSWST